MSLPEVLLWQQLRQRPGDFKFRRQHPNGKLALDFACMAARLVIEVDGEAHNRGDQPQFDVARDASLAAAGYLTLRVPATAILRNLDAVITGIVTACRERGPSTVLRTVPLPVPGRN
ncbi:endonuclease domain-containing protein [Sphingomonas sp. SUN019]|uniref:endonuclease domain-containing protein n=1 Tax=Sphingomonas sp. SUN019 TaxID=2937788 RepID=UPI002164598B|nr:endonuclease domain-containing protein [Sphingomonas sp. SUN019]UVO49845.1 endonuclease domain-containing protein [Sphingomonas sp. SUN019]